MFVTLGALSVGKAEALTGCTCAGFWPRAHDANNERAKAAERGAALALDPRLEAEPGPVGPVGADGRGDVEHHREWKPEVAQQGRQPVHSAPRLRPALTRGKFHRRPRTMDTEVKASLANAVQACLSIIRQVGPRCLEPHLVYTSDKNNRNGLQGTYVPLPSLRRVFIAAGASIGATASDFAKVFEASHPDHCGKFACSAHSFKLDLLHVPWDIAVEVWRECGPDSEGGVVARLVDNFAAFVDASHIRIRFSAQLLNFTGVDHLSLPDNLVVRRQSDKELTEIHGGDIMDIDFKLATGRARGTRYVIEGYYDEPKRESTQPEIVDLEKTQAASRLEKAMLAFRTFKAGSVGYQHIDFRTETYATPRMSVGHNDLSIPRGVYSLEEAEVSGFLAHASLISKIKESGPLDMACRRLADAETRNRPEDKIVDAVIAMEAVLLGAEDGHSDLVLKFCLNYALLFSPAERMHAYEEARAFYTMRSTIAHGSRLDPKNLKVKGEPSMTLHDAAMRVTVATRHVIHYFLKSPTAGYEAKDFWRRKYLGVASD